MWPEGAFTSHFWQTAPVLASPSHYSQGLSTLLQGNNSHRLLSGGLAATWLGGPTPVTRQGNFLERRRRRNCIEKNIPQDLQSSADEGNSPRILSLCQGLVAEPTRLRTLNSKLEEFGTVQGSPSNFASIPQQCLCLLNIFWVSCEG